MYPLFFYYIILMLSTLFALCEEPFIGAWTFRPGEVSVFCHEPFVEFEAVLSHREFNRMQARLFDFNKYFIRLTTVLTVCSLLAFPPP